MQSSISGGYAHQSMAPKTLWILGDSSRGGDSNVDGDGDGIRDGDIGDASSIYNNGDGDGDGDGQMGMGMEMGMKMEMVIGVQDGLLSSD